MATIKSESSMNGLTIHKVARDTMYDSTAAQEVLAAMGAAGPNEIFILEDEPYYYTVIPYKTTLQTLVSNALSGLGIASNNFMNSAKIDGKSLVLGATNPANTYTITNVSEKIYLSTQEQSAYAYDLQVSYPWSNQ